MDNLKQLIESKNIVVVDLETSGLDTNRDCIIELAAVKIENEKLCDRFCRIVYTPQIERLPAEVERITGITIDQSGCVLTIDEVLKKLYSFAKGCILVIHNLPFQFAFLRNWGFWCGVHFDKFEKDAIDTIDLAKQVLGDKVKNYKLATLADYFNIKFAPQLTLDYAEATAKIFLELAKS